LGSHLGVVGIWCRKAFNLLSQGGPGHQAHIGQGPFEEMGGSFQRRAFFWDTGGIEGCF